jgi:hypothetical protein
MEKPVSIPPSDVDLEELHLAGQNKRLDEHDAEYKANSEGLRGGSSACLLDDGRLLGKCGRLSHLSSLGISEQLRGGKQLMFEAGFLNEDAWLTNLKANWEGQIRCEEEIPTRWELSSGTPVTGRPDIVLCDEDGNAQVGLELKLVSSPFTAYNVMAKQVPTLDHLPQAMHYMVQLDVPFKLVYTSRSNYSLGFGSMKKTWDTVPHQYFNEKRTSIEPFVKVYDLWMEDGHLCYDTDRLEQAVKTDLTWDSVVRYYEAVDNAAQGLPPRPTGGTVLGDKLSWHPCDRCWMADVCDGYEHDYDTWLDFAKAKNMEQK